MRLFALFFVVLCVSLCRACQLLDRGVSEEDKKLIVDLHNQLRQKVASGQEGNLPKAANMKNLVWDEAHAQKAQQWTENCKFEHNSFEDRQIGDETAGQNIYKAPSNDADVKPDWNSTIHLWYSEVSKFDPNTIDKYVFDRNTGHFSQIIWANTAKIGCGYAKSGEDGEYKAVQYMACHYSPAGNMQDATVYTRA